MEGRLEGQRGGDGVRKVKGMEKDRRRKRKRRHKTHSTLR